MKHTLAVACISLKSVWQAVCRPFLNQLRRLFAFGYLRCTSVPLRSGSFRSLHLLLLAPVLAAENSPIRITDRSVVFTHTATNPKDPANTSGYNLSPIITLLPDGRRVVFVAL